MKPIYITCLIMWCVFFCLDLYSLRVSISEGAVGTSVVNGLLTLFSSAMILHNAHMITKEENKDETQ